MGIWRGKVPNRKHKFVCLCMLQLYCNPLYYGAFWILLSNYKSSSLPLVSEQSNAHAYCWNQRTSIYCQTNCSWLQYYETVQAFHHKRHILTALNHCWKQRKAICCQIACRWLQTRCYETVSRLQAGHAETHFKLPCFCSFTIPHVISKTLCHKNCHNDWKKLAQQSQTCTFIIFFF